MDIIEQLNGTKAHFIVGVGRSGTTILSLVLNAHPQVSCTPEVKQLMTFYKDYAKQNPMSDKFIDDFLLYQKTRYKNTTKGIFWGFDLPKFIDTLKQLSGKLNYAQVGKLFLRSVKTEQKQDDAVKVVINKNPDFTFCIKELLELYPDAKILVSLRDYRAVCLSQKESKDTNNFSKFFGNSAAAIAQSWYIHNAEVLHCMQQYPEQIKLVPYESLVSDKENLVREVCSFLSIDFLPEMLNPEKQTQNKATETDKLTDNRKAKRKGDLTKEVFTDRLTAWKQGLTAREIATCEAICGDIGQQLGYETTTKISPAQKWWLKISNAPQLIATNTSHTVFMRWYYHLPFKWRLFMVKYLNIKR